MMSLISPFFGKHKKNGININSLLKALVSYKLTDNFSIKKAHEWINRDEVLDLFDLDTFSERTLYRVLETIGANKEEIISYIQIAYSKGMISNIPISIWTGQALFFMEIKLHLGNMAIVVIIDQIRSK